VAACDAVMHGKCSISIALEHPSSMLGFATCPGGGGQARAHGRAAAAAAAASARPCRHRRRGAGARARGGRGGYGGSAGGAGLRGAPGSRGACRGVRWGGLGGLPQGCRRGRRVLLGAGGAGRGGAGQRRARKGGRAADIRDLALQVRARPMACSLPRPLTRSARQSPMLQIFRLKQEWSIGQRLELRPGLQSDATPALP